MTEIDRVRGLIPEAAKDIKLNLQAVLSQTTLSPEQLWGVAVASAATSRNAALLSATLADASAQVSPAVIDDGLAAAALMGMNNVYYRFRHMVSKPSYADKPARLRMNRMGKPATNKTDFELFSLAASAINGCETCVRAHEAIVVQGGLTEEQVHDAVRVAAVLHAAAVSLDFQPAASSRHAAVVPFELQPAASAG